MQKKKDDISLFTGYVRKHDISHFARDVKEGEKYKK
jgi:hypothetical protein